MSNISNISRSDEENVKLDPRGDVLIIQTPPSEPFAAWPEQDDDGNDTKRAEMGTKGETKEFRAVCSSSILCLVSRPLRKQLKGDWGESKVQDDGFHHLVYKKTFDSDAFLQVLNILHHRSGLNPGQLGVEGLAKIAEIGHYWECEGALSPAIENWTSKYQGLPKGKFSREIVLWLLVSGVFGLRAIFDSAATMAIEHGVGRLNTLNLPIEERIVGSVDKHREARVKKLVMGLYELREKLDEGKIGCSLTCSQIHVGALQWVMRQRKIWPRKDGWPGPDERFDGISVSGLCEMAEKFGEEFKNSEVYKACHPTFDVSNPRKPKISRGCGVRDEIEGILKMGKGEYILGIELKVGELSELRGGLVQQGD